LSQEETPDYIDIDLGGDRYDEIGFNFSRTLIAKFYRLFQKSSDTTLVLWDDDKSKPTTDYNKPDKWPDYKTEANMRVLVNRGTKTVDGFIQTYGGSEATVTTIADHQNPDIEKYHRMDLDIERQMITGIAPLRLDKLLNNDYFYNPIEVDGYGTYWLQKAEQINGRYYKLTLLK